MMINVECGLFSFFVSIFLDLLFSVTNVFCEKRLLMDYKSRDRSLDPPLRRSEPNSELFTGDTSKHNHSPGPVIRGARPEKLTQ